MTNYDQMVQEALEYSRKNHWVSITHKDLEDLYCWQYGVIHKDDQYLDEHHMLKGYSENPWPVIYGPFTPEWEYKIIEHERLWRRAFDE